MKKETLGRYGPEDSRYLNLVARRAEAKGIKTAWVAGPTPGCAAYVADTEAGWPMWDLPREEDVDCIQHLGLSCCAAGFLPDIKVILRNIFYPHGRLCIIGRGHAVQGLAEAVTADGHVVDQCSSAALDIGCRVAKANIVVNSAREVQAEVLEAINCNILVFDVSGGMDKLRGKTWNYIPPWEIGAWNIAELLRRVRVRIEEVMTNDAAHPGV